MYAKTLSFLAAASLALAQRPSNTSMCDYYTTALFTDNTAANQYALVKAVVDRAGVGNATSNPVVTGIVKPGMYNGVKVDISPYFTGALNSTNRGGSSGVSVNFLDGGSGATPAANSNQAILFTHLYEYFGAVLGCTTYGSSGYPNYAGKASMYEVHKFMGLDENMVGYFNEQVGLSAASFGVTNDDVTAVGKALNSLFNVKCAPATTVIKEQGAQLQSICIADSCPLSPNATCSSYQSEPMPVAVMPGSSSNSSSSGNSSSSSGSATHSSGSSSTGSSPAQQTTNAASAMGVSAVVGVAALLFAL
ncbi:hypothetical protein K461DRAFT_276484 [Myriangium duriaei CBS 260.36]|uniref:Uncharacterized protein n=1 Tax=Myriangium duriaei CBS 260.36 TaxID=1168546 RepID=A0A9P4J729_9PEZI|nr:hypothetical protein K461DRAFT_276484 [Myriangium duriaei CBS 260.36]